MEHSVDLSQEQEGCVGLVKEGHNLLVCGQAGTGKSTVVKHMVRHLQAAGKCVAVTATTGIACQQFPDAFHAMTMHRWAGLLDGRYTVEKLCKLLMHDEKYADAKRRIQTSDVLVVDEVSMLSKKLFGCLEEICRNLREYSTPFGGLHVILSGDFYQLPPVKDALYGDDGEFCFQHPLWPKAFPHVVELGYVHRRREPRLIRAVSEVAKGYVSEDTIGYLKSLSESQQQLGELTDPIKIFATNHQVDIHNLDCIAEMDGEAISFRAEDTGDESYLKKVLAPRVLHLKRLCQVMLVSNLSDKLVNGSLGRIVDFGQSGPVVEFFSAGVTLPITKTAFTVYSPALGVNIAERQQIPLRPAYAITAHKSQGMTIDHVEVDCHRMNRPGQLGVAIGRARESKGLRIINLNPACFVEQPALIQTFYETLSHGVLHADWSCCRNGPMIQIDDKQSNNTTPTLLENTISHFEEDFSDQEEFNEDELQTIDQLIEESVIEEEQIIIPEEFDLDNLLSRTAYGTEFTPFQVQVNTLLRRLQEGTMAKLKKFISENIDTITECMSTQLTKEKVDQKDATQAYANYYEYVSSDLYKTRCARLFNTGDPQIIGPEKWNLAYRLCTEIRKMFISKTADEVERLKPTINVSRSLPNNNLTVQARAKIRYVSGYVISKIRYHHQRAATRRMNRLDDESRSIVHQEESKVKLLSETCRTEQQILGECDDKDSLSETSRRQNIRQSLVHITDSTYSFFTILCAETIKLENSASISVHGQYTHHHIITTLMENDDLKQEFMKLFNTEYAVDLGSLENHRDRFLQDIYFEVVNLFSKVMLKQLRKDYLAEVNKRKKLAHRKQVLVAGTVSQSSSELKWEDLITDESSEKLQAHKMLQSYAIQHSKMPPFTKGQLQTLCKSYGLTFLVREIKSILEARLVDEIKRRNFFTNPDVLAGPKQSKEQQRRGQKRKAKGDANKCVECRQGSVDDGEDEWITCKRCHKHYHRACAEIWDDDEWLMYFMTDFICHNC